MGTVRAREKKKSRWAVIDRALPAIFAFFVFFLYYSLLSEPYFTDEQDVFYGAYHVAKGRDLYQSFLTQHMPFSYYIIALVALCGARTVFQFRLGTYLLLTLLWEIVFLRHRRRFHPLSLFAMPLLYLFVLRTLFMGTTMISDHWQGIGLVLIMLETVRYMESERISLSCALMVSLGLVLSFGTTFGSAYSVLCYFLAVVSVQARILLRARKDQKTFPALRRKILLEDLRLVGICLAPFALLMLWYLLTNNINNFYEGAYEIVTTLYSKYTGGLSSNPVGAFWTTVRDYFEWLGSQLATLPSQPWPALLYLAFAVVMAVFCVRLGKKSVPVGSFIFLAAVYAGLRGFAGFHGMAYHAVATAVAALFLSPAFEWCMRGGRVRRYAGGIIAFSAAAGLLVNFVIWSGYNLLYPQILEDRTPRCEVKILDLLTEPNDEIFVCNAPINSLDVMDLELIPIDACDAVTYPYFYAMWGQRQMASIRKLPPVVIYNPDEIIWGEVFKEYAPDFDSFMRANYLKLAQAEDLWVSEAFAQEASRRLTEAGYGNLVDAVYADRNQKRPAEYLAGQSVQARFQALAGKLTAIRFCGACFYRRSDPTLTLRLSDAETGELISEATVTGDEIADNFFSRCPMEATLVPGRSYDLVLSVEKIDGKGDMEFYFRPGGTLCLAPEYLTGV